MERRVAPRIALALTCYVVLDPTVPGQLVGLTENISRSGVLVALPEGSAGAKMLNRGDHVELHVELPARRDGIPPRSIRCLATVARCEANGQDQVRLALAVHQMRFCELPRRLRALNLQWQDCQPVM